MPKNPENPKIRIDPFPEQSGFSDFYRRNIFETRSFSQGMKAQ